MDAKIVRNQISYWEMQEKEIRARIKTETDVLKSVQATIKTLKSLLPKSDAPEPEQFADVSQ